MTHEQRIDACVRAVWGQFTWLEAIISLDRDGPARRLIHALTIGQWWRALGFHLSGAA